MQVLSKPTYSEQVVELIKKRIRTGRLRGGERVSEAAIAQECGISRAPVRDALYILEGMGLLTSHAKRGKVVTTLTVDEIKNRYELAGLLEGAAAASAVAHMSEGSWRELRGILETMRAAVEGGGEIEEHADLGSRFHDCILRHAPNPIIASLARKSCRAISKYLLFQCWRKLYTPAELYDRHLRVYDALQSKKTVSIEEAMRAHYAESGARMVEAGQDILKNTQEEASPRKSAVFPTE